MSSFSTHSIVINLHLEVGAFFEQCGLLRQHGSSLTLQGACKQINVNIVSLCLEAKFLQRKD
jgi:hypothetical protein